MEEERRERQLRLSSTVLTVFPSVTTANIAAAAPPSSPADRETVSFNLERKQSSFTLATSTPFPSIYLAAAVACLLTRVAGATGEETLNIRPKNDFRVVLSKKF